MAVQVVMVAVLLLLATVVAEEGIVAGGAIRVVLGPPAVIRPPVSTPDTHSDDTNSDDKVDKTWTAVWLTVLFAPPIVVVCCYNIFKVLKDRFPDTITFSLSGTGRTEKYVTISLLASYLLVAALAIYKLIE